MTGIIVAFPKQENAKSIKNILVRSGFTVTGICTTGAQAAAMADELGGGIMLCSYKLTDMMYSELRNYLPEGFEIKQLRAEYKKQALLGDVFYPYVEEHDGTYGISLNDSGGSAYAVIEFQTNRESE